MSNKRSKITSPAGTTNVSPSREVLGKSVSTSRNIRETIESVAIAFILAFLFRTFEAEAFVIPTGSMAPTLQGEHKDLKCIKCGYRYRVNASSESDPKAKRFSLVVAGTCPQCRYTVNLDPLGRNFDDRDQAEVDFGEAQETFSGDRILVSKFVYDFSPPSRWDVIVFKYPGDTKMNYIKRLIGLPGEEIHIRHGDIHTRPTDTQAPLQMERKQPLKQLAMMQVVYDNAFASSELVKKNWPSRWQAFDDVESLPETGWQQAAFTAEQLEKKHVQPLYTIPAEGEGDRWLRYQHFVPTWDDWQAMEAGPLGENYAVRPQLITDFYAYNTGLQLPLHQPLNSIAPSPQMLGLHWVGDLMLQGEVAVQSESGELLLDLVLGGYHFTCRIDVATGDAQLESSAEALKDFHPQAKTNLRGPGTYEIKYSNVDHQIRLWIDGTLVEFDQPTTYELLVNRPQSNPTDLGDLAPAGIGSRDVALQVSKLKIWRDIYYIATSNLLVSGSYELNDYDYDTDGTRRITSYSAEEYADFLSTPALWEVYTKRRTVFFSLKKTPNDPQRDQFFMLGDNSPSSKDSRLWPDGHELKHYVERNLLIGKALCIYWPHPWHEIPGLDIPFPYFPNFGDMGRVR